ncbi:hypothetical protein CRG98_042000 [Punica granatum]|uniref:Increased DNA methylation 1 n=1 Tax=Punica granatum TaxID=22663 RepID=A0A2I0I172_PUNGR|nr:hypothetical protein CRG98_042000 [Punica granatum]
MFFDNGIENFFDDGFEGSTDERRIFREVFLGYHPGNDGGRKFSGAFNFECPLSKNTDSSICSNSDCSALTSQSSPNILSLPEPVTVNDDGRGNSAVRCFSDDFAIQQMSNPHVFLEQTKLSVEQPSGAVIDEKVLNSSMISYESISGTPHGADSVFHTATFPLVESFRQGVAWNYYLLKQNVATNGEVSVGITDALNGRFLALDGNLGKEVHASKAIASPVSQESYATRLLVASQSPCVGGQLEYAAQADERTMDYDIPGLGSSSIVESDAAKDPRPLLFSYALDLLKAAGWLITKHKRPCRRYLESKYRSPAGRSFREFSKVWKACGEILLADRYVMLQQDDGQGWNDITLFFSELYDTLMSMKIEQNQLGVSRSLVQQWNILNPFVTVIFIDKKIGMLRKGEVVKAKCNLLVDKYEKRNVVLGLSHANGKDGRRGTALNCGDVNMNEHAQRQLPGPLSHPVESKERHFNDINEKRDTVLGLKCADKYGMRGSVLALNRGDVKMNKLAQGQLSGLLSHPAECKVRLFNDKNEKRDTVLGLKCGDFKASLLFGGQFPGLISDWSHPSDSGVAVLDGKADAFPKQSHGEYFLQSSFQRTEETERSLLGTSVYMPTVNDDGLMETGEGIRGRHCDEIDGGNPLLTLNSVTDAVNAMPSPCNNNFPRSGSVYSLPDALALAFPHSDGKPRDKAKPLDVDASLSQLELDQKQERVEAEARSQGSYKSSISFSEHQFEKKRVKQKKIHQRCDDIEKGKKRSRKCEIDDDELLVSAIIKNKEVLSLSQFKIHAGFKLNRPCLSLFMESGEPFTLCELQAWSSEYKSRKSGKLTHQADDNDQNDDSCGLCGDGGELICCDNCPSTFHQACLLTEDLPEGNWYCANCTCRMCGCLVDRSSSDARKCSQCEHKYHESCMKEKKLDPVVSDAWFCGGSCREVQSGLHSRIGLINHIADGYSWTLLRCIHDDQKVHSAQRFALKAECNSKLAVALSIVEECFASMVDLRTGIDMIPHVMYNWGSEFARLNFQGFCTMVLEKDDVLITAASVRLHGVAVAEMPLIATCSKFRRRGMCRRLMTALEELLISLKVEKLVIAAIPELVETWTKGFNFEIVEKDEKQSLKKINLMVFPGTILLKKPLFQSHNADTRTGHVGLEDFAKEANTHQLSINDAPDSEVIPAIKSEHQPQGEPHNKDDILGEKINSMEQPVAQGKPKRVDQTIIVKPVNKDGLVPGRPEIDSKGPKVVLGLTILRDQFLKPSCTESVCNAGVSPSVYGLKQVSFRGTVSEAL